MSRLEHSPAPFALFTSLPSEEGKGGHIIVDAFGDSIGALAFETGDHPAEEQLANARLFRASPKLLASLKALTAGLPELLESIGYQDDENLISEALAAITLAEMGS